VLRHIDTKQIISAAIVSCDTPLGVFALIENVLQPTQKILKHQFKFYPSLSLFVQRTNLPMDASADASRLSNAIFINRSPFVHFKHLF